MHMYMMECCADCKMNVVSIAVAVFRELQCCVWNNPDWTESLDTLFKCLHVLGCDGPRL